MKDVGEGVQERRVESNSAKETKEILIGAGNF